ncbi:MAG: hypothetical protein KatS3mg008_1449 [Acidimicrobiales bacterium]|nr:MAG: hypothetical protein KatS3mg008_1449 [Acidimicrobiales bacterium]
MPESVTVPDGKTDVLRQREGDEPDVAHIARSEDVTRAYVTGEPIKALCGVVFVPSRDPSQFPVCEACRRVLDRIRAARIRAN